MTAAPVPPAAELNADSVVTTLGDADPPPVVPPFCDAQPSARGLAATKAGMVHAVIAATSVSIPGSVSSSPHEAASNQVSAMPVAAKPREWGRRFMSSSCAALCRPPPSRKLNHRRMLPRGTVATPVPPGGTRWSRRGKCLREGAGAAHVGGRLRRRPLGIGRAECERRLSSAALPSTARDGYTSRRIITPPEWRNGIRSGRKIRRPQGLTSSSLVSGTSDAQFKPGRCEIPIRSAGPTSRLTGVSRAASGG